MVTSPTLFVGLGSLREATIGFEQPLGQDAKMETPPILLSPTGFVLGGAVLVSVVSRKSGGVGADLDCIPFYLSRVLYAKSVIFFCIFHILCCHLCNCITTI
jgi:hypothetical protein